jgi:autotransporter-associated beta strand protein
LTRLVAAVVAVTVLAADARAQTYTWFQPATGTAGSWATATWVPGVPVPGTTTVLALNTLSGNTNSYTFTNDIGAFTANGLTFNNSGTGTLTVDLAANPLTLGGANPFLANNGPGSVSVSGAGGVILTGPTVFTGTGPGFLGVSSVISGTGGLTIDQTGNGVVRLTGTNTFTGGVTINSGTLEVFNDAGFGDPTNGITVVGGTLSLGGITTSRAISFAGAATIIGNPTLNGVLSGSGSLTRLASGISLNFDAANTYSGAITVGAPGAVGSKLVTPSITAAGIALTAGGRLDSASSITINTNQLLSIVRGTSTLTTADRLGTVPITLNGGAFTYSPGSAAESTTTLGPLTLGPGQSVFRTAAVNGAVTNQLNFGALTRVDNATLLLGANTTGNGQMGGPPSFLTLNLRFASGIVDPGGSGIFRGVIPWAAFTGTGVTTGQVDGNIAAMTATYDANGFRPLAASEYRNEFLANANVKIDTNFNSSTTLTAPLTINSLNVQLPGSITGNGNTLTITSGSIVNRESHTFSNTTLAFPSGVTGYIHQGNSVTFSGTSNVTGDSGLVISGYL